MERMEGDGEKREVSTGGHGREAEAERVIPGRRIIGTAHGLGVYRRGGLPTSAFETHIGRNLRLVILGKMFGMNGIARPFS
jgi:hypothetical protein